MIENKNLIQQLKEELIETFGESNENKINSQILALTFSKNGLTSKVISFLNLHF